MNRRLIAAISIVLVAGAAWFIRSKIETLGDRRRVADEIRGLVDQIERDPSDTRALDRIREILNGNWSFARTYACGALRDLGPKAAPAIPDVIDALNCGDPFVEREAARALGAIGRAEAVAPLIAKLQDEDDDAGWFAAESLGEIGRPAVSAIPFLEKAAGSKNEFMAESTNKSLEKLRGKIPNN